MRARGVLRGRAIAFEVVLSCTWDNAVLSDRRTFVLGPPAGRLARVVGTARSRRNGWRENRTFNLRVSYGASIPNDHSAHVCGVLGYWNEPMVSYRGVNVASDRKMHKNGLFLVL